MCVKIILWKCLNWDKVMWQLVPLIAVESVVGRGLLDVQGFLYPELDRSIGPVQPGCWIATVKKLGGGVSSSRASANRVSAWTSAPDRMRAQAQEPRL